MSTEAHRRRLSALKRASTRLVEAGKTWRFSSYGFPRDLNARLTEASTKGQLMFLAAKEGKSRGDIRRLLIDKWIKREGIAYARCLCEAARRGLLPVGDVEDRVNEHLRYVAHRRLAEIDRAAGSDFAVREVVDRVTASPQWRGYLKKRRLVAEVLATADSASTEVERRAETPAPLAASTVDENPTEQPTASPLPVPLSVAEFAERLGVADDKIYRMIKEHTLQAFRVGTTWRIDQSELDRLRGAAPEKYPDKKR